MTGGRSVTRRAAAIRRPAGPPWYGVDDAAMRFLEIHEARAHALGGRILRDLDDCVHLHAPNDPEPFFNRVAAVRWPESPGAFDHRLAEIMALFAGLDRRPHVWTAAGFNRPADLARRLGDHGFTDMGGGFVMVVARRRVGELGPPPTGVMIECVHGGLDVVLPEAMTRDVGLVLAESFGLDVDRREAIQAETTEALKSPVLHVYLVTADGEPVAVGKRYTFDGASYLSAIGTRPGYEGRGYGSLVTDALIRDSLAAGARHVYLGVHTHNDRAIEVYRRAGLEIVGERAGDFILT